MGHNGHGQAKMTHNGSLTRLDSNKIRNSGVKGLIFSASLVNNEDKYQAAEMRDVSLLLLKRQSLLFFFRQGKTFAVG